MGFIGDVSSTCADVVTECHECICKTLLPIVSTVRFKALIKSAYAYIPQDELCPEQNNELSARAHDIRFQQKGSSTSQKLQDLMYQCEAVVLCRRRTVSNPTYTY